MTKRYTIKLDIHRVDEQGEVLPNCPAGVVMRWATTDLNGIIRVLDETAEYANFIIHERDLAEDSITVRRPE